MTEPRLDLARTYAAIVEAARAKRYLSYVEVARASGVEWRKARLPMGHHLDKLLLAAQARGWPLLTALVVRKDDVDTGHLTGGARFGFLQGLQRLGIAVADTDADAFIRAEQRRTFEWAAGAPESPDFPTAPPRAAAARSPVSQGVPDLDDSVRYWFVGAVWDGDDQLARFIADGIWQNGHENDPLVDEMRPGDRIAIKASYVRKHDVPFDVGGRKVAAMKIKAVGTIVANDGDHATVRVDWRVLAEPREWYFYTYRVALVRADPANAFARRLIEFTFHDAPQDYAYWLQQPYFREKYLSADARTDTADDLVGESAESGEGARYTIEDIVLDGCFVAREELARTLERLRRKKNLILQGPPGTGKTWLAKRLGYAVLGTDDADIVRQRMRVVQFHPTLSYEDFVRGWRPGKGSTLELVDGLFLEAVQAARTGGDAFVFVIEEINRGNPAQIFGELLTLLEASKRDEKEALELAYRREGAINRIHLPPNLYVIGTMNLADRSLAIVDMALRRRFAFVDLAPAFGTAWRAWCAATGHLPATAIDAIERGMLALNERIAAAPALGTQYGVGHSYFTPTEIIDDADLWFDAIVDTEIAPLLAEYWYDEPAQAESAVAQLRDHWRSARD